jgi:hypothetical protein
VEKERPRKNTGQEKNGPWGWQPHRRSPAPRCLPRRRLDDRRRRRPTRLPPGAQVFVGPFAGDKNTPPPCTTAPSLPFLLYEIQHQTLTVWLSVFGFDPITNVVYVVLFVLTSFFFAKIIGWTCVHPMHLAGSAPGPRVSLEITDEMLKSMKVGLACQDYVSSLFFLLHHSNSYSWPWTT